MRKTERTSTTHTTPIWETIALILSIAIIGVAFIVPAWLTALAGWGIFLKVAAIIYLAVYVLAVFKKTSVAALIGSFFAKLKKSPKLAADDPGHKPELKDFDDAGIEVTAGYVPTVVSVIRGGKVEKVWTLAAKLDPKKAQKGMEYDEYSNTYVKKKVTPVDPAAPAPVDKAELTKALLAKKCAPKDVPAKVAEATPLIEYGLTIDEAVDAVLKA